MKTIAVKYLPLIALLLLIIYLFQKINWLPSFKNPFRSNPLTIDASPLLIKEINDLSQLITISIYDEVVIDSSRPKNLPSFPGLRPVPDKIVLIAKGKVFGGINLKKLLANNVFTSKDSVSIMLPGAEILNTSINPSDIEIFDEIGSWSDEAVQRMKIKAREKIIARAFQQGIISKANEKAKVVMESFMIAAGFNKINITF